MRGGENIAQAAGRYNLAAKTDKDVGQEQRGQKCSKFNQAQGSTCTHARTHARAGGQACTYEYKCSQTDKNMDRCAV